MSIDPRHQLVILTRLGELCRFRGATLYHERDPWNYMRRKLQETEPALEGLKGGLFRATNKGLLEELAAGRMDEERYADYKTLYEKLLTSGDFADLAIHLEPSHDPRRQAEWCRQALSQIQPMNLFIEERKPPTERGSDWERLVSELYRRLGLDCLEKILARKPRTAKRKAVVLRRLRANVAEYCSVVHIPTNDQDTFTPFMLPRIEGLIAANLRFLDRYR
jgi:hypothetical protein